MDKEKLMLKEYNGTIKLEVINISERSYSPEYFKIMGQKKIKGIHITRSLFSSKISTDLKFLEGVTDKSAVKVILVDVDLNNALAIDVLYLFENLTNLSLTNSSATPLLLNLEKFKNLKNLTLKGNIDVVGLEKIQLKSLQIVKNKEFNITSWGNSIEEISFYNSKVNLEKFKELSSVKKLILTKTETYSLIGIGNLKNLKNLEINYCSKLTDISQLKDCVGITKLYLESIKNLKDFSPLKELKQLNDLTLLNCGDVASLKFINDIPSLENLLFTGTNIVDGDLTPCLRLKSAWSSLGKKHYNINVDDLPNNN